MIAPNMLATIKSQLAESVSLSELDDGRIGISLPLTYDDGDHCTCFAERESNGWVLRDFGDVVTRASYREVNLLSKGYSERLNKLAEFYGAKASKSGELEIAVRNGNFGDAIFAFAQTCLALQSLAKTRPEKQATEPPTRFHKEVTSLVAAQLPVGHG